ncbi:MAG: DUF3618 domain-containing protein [Gemmatimonadales bacterium]
MTDYNQGGESRRTAAIESDIETTRNRMGEGIEAIGDKFRPERIKQQAKDAVSRKTREAGASLWRTAKENPVPSAIVALGLTLLFKARSKKHNGNGYSLESMYDENSSEGVKEKAQEFAGKASEKVSHVAHGAAEKAKSTGITLKSFFQNNPVIAGAGVIVLGAAVGALLPSTEKENKIMGHKRDELVREAKHVASKAQDTMKETLAEHGSSNQQSSSQQSNQFTQSQGGGYGTR